MSAEKTRHSKEQNFTQLRDAQSGPAAVGPVFTL